MSETTASASVITSERLAGAYTYAAYRQLIDELLAQGRTTGPNQSEDLTRYAQLNLQRMQRLDKTVTVLPELQAAVAQLRQRYVWLVLTEGWCGDAAQIVPVLHAVASASNGHLTDRYLLRDDNLDLMDRYLTGGVSRSIPKLVVLHADTLTEAATWGPRPAQAQELLLRLKAAGATHEEYAEQVHGWYAKDKTRSTQLELLELVQRLA
ncbi:thioredoxin family protein [Hymenobacter busanensis]|uniref:Thioredoxin family protein n=1 Tax=Hymenobacter busanensis TaxID=2607656 RepID=A0A7L4ZZI8_9BACT|nr:thioredoxin family protein [Hymenobacter busanensis]KAA9332973.1 thioredoxin family protein [Hymenobacter busanensis]QHJ08353.1 thioredoxin family protein [Hymenobacter busanensis]